MAENSKIEWCHHTTNLWHGCFEVHTGCDRCYAKIMSNRFHKNDLLWQQQGPRMFIKSAFSDLLKYQARAAKENTKYYIFMNSMSDIFEKSMPMVDFNHQPLIKDGEQVYTEDIRNMFFTYVDACPNLIFLLLTKRPSNILKMIPQTWIDKPRPNVIFGTSIVDQETADTLIPQLLKVPGLHFLSMEPLVGRVDIRETIFAKGPCPTCDGCGSIPANDAKTFEEGGGGVTCPECMYDLRNYRGKSPIDWVIVGGESGHDARPMNSKWAEDLLEQCSAAGVPFFFKQWGEWMPLGNNGFINKAADGTNRFYHYEEKINGHRFRRSNNQVFHLSGKKETGSLLKGIEFKQFPI